jgi:flagellar hook protein FlgE
MSLALFSGLSGLRANQQYLDVIGNNLANSNTPGYKSSRVTFGDVLSQSLRRGSAPTATLGGVNPTQLGRGVSVASIDQNFSQGRLVATGRTLDLAVQGEGFFVATDGTNNFFSRVGAFGIDGDQKLVDLRTGYRIRSDTGGDIQLPLSGVLPPQQTESIAVRGNLAGKVNGPTIEEWTSDGPYLEATPAQAVGTATGTAGLFDFSAPGDNVLTINVSGTTRTVTLTPGVNLPSTASLSSLSVSDVVSALNATPSGLAGAVASEVGSAPTSTLAITTTASGDEATLTISGPAASILGIATSATGTQTVATATSPLNDLKFNVDDYVAGDIIRVRGSKPDGTTVDASFIYGTDGTTLGDLLTFTNTLFAPDATVTLDVDGVAHLTAANPGESSLSLNFSDDTVTGGGESNFSAVEFQVDVVGEDPDVETASLTVFDSLGVEHTLSVQFERQITGDWAMTVDFPGSDGTLQAASLPTLLFGTDGKLPGSVVRSIDVTWNSGNAAPQTINFVFEDPVSGEQLTQLGDGPSISATQDGYAAGTLSSFAVEPDGTIRGDYTNGLSQEIAKMQVALFTNPAGLERAGSGFFVATSNSGQPQFATAGAGSAGAVVSGSLEGSNVDVAEEFVRLIEAQRGFQANARIISTSNEVLAELTRLGQ